MSSILQLKHKLEALKTHPNIYTSGEVLRDTAHALVELSDAFDKHIEELPALIKNYEAAVIENTELRKSMISMQQGHE